MLPSGAPNMTGMHDINRALWARSGSARPALRALEGQLDADVVVIGAGYTGLSCALHLAELGHKAIVLEAREPGWGGSGRNAGQWLPGWAGRTPASVEDQFGAERGRALNQFNLQASRDLPEFMDAHRIAAEHKRSGVLVVAHTRKKLVELETMNASWGVLGANAALIRKEDLGAYLNTERYFGGLLYRDGGSLNPMAYARGLARAAQSNGVVIYGSSPALQADSRNDRWHVSTPNGVVIADRIAICTNAYTGDLWPGLQKSFYRLRIAMLASDIMPDKGRSFMTGGIPFADTNALSLFGGMQDAAGRFVASVLPGRSDKISTRSLARGFDAKFRRVFKGQEPPSWQQSWLGDLCVVPDRIPKFYRLGPGAMAAMGYSGAGIALGTAMGRELARCLSSDSSHDCPVPVVESESVPLVRTLPLLHRHLIAPLARRLDRFY